MDLNPSCQRLLTPGFRAPRSFIFLGRDVNDGVVITSGSLLNAVLQLVHGHLSFSGHLNYQIPVNGKHICAWALLSAGLSSWLFFCIQSTFGFFFSFTFVSGRKGWDLCCGRWCQGNSCYLHYLFSPLHLQTHSNQCLSTESREIWTINAWKLKLRRPRAKWLNLEMTTSVVYH